MHPVERNEGMNKTSMELEGQQDIVISRVFRAPPRIVFEAYTKAEFVSRWWAPKSHGASLVECTADVRTGGRYRYVMNVREQGNMAFSGEYREVTPYTKLVYTQVFEPMADAGAVVATVTFEEVNGQTKLTSRERYPSKEAREAAVASGMESGMRESMEQLEELVFSLAK